MHVFASILLLALTPAELVERLQMPVVTKAQGLVQVYADCSEDMRQEFQMPVASFVADLCDRLARGLGVKRTRLHAPGIVLHLGDIRTNVTDVIVRTVTRRDGRTYTRMTLPAPGHADVARLRLEIVKAFYREFFSREIDAYEAAAALRLVEPALRVNDRYDLLRQWTETGSIDTNSVAWIAFAANGAQPTDETMIALARTVLNPGRANADDVMRFASRLQLYPPTFDAPFCGKFHSCTFREAIELGKVDPRVRFMAYFKARQVLVLGGGRGEGLAAAAAAYATFLKELVRGKESAPELIARLDAADARLRVLLGETTRAAGEGNGR